MKQIELLTRILLLFSVISSIAFVSACSRNIKTSDPNPTPTINRLFGPVNDQWSALSIHLNSSVDLPDGTILQTQLYFRNNLQAWWPANQYIQVQNGRWDIIVTANENGAPQKLPLLVSGYSFRVWVRDNPTIVSDFPFVISGPPPP